MSDSDQDQEEDREQEQENNVPPKGMDSDFCKRVKEVKWKLYQIIVLGPELNTPHAQNNELIRVYLLALERLYQFLESAQKGHIMERELIQFPSVIRSENLSLAEWIRKYFKQNVPADTIPYRDYLNTSLRVYPFVQHMRMMGGTALSDDVEQM